MGIEKEIQSKFKDDFHKGYVNLLFTSYYLEEKTREFLKKYGITSQQYNILRILRGAHPKSCNINYIKERVMDKMSDVSRLIVRLETKNWVIKNLSSTDKRNTELIITEEALLLLKKIDRDIEELQSIMKKLEPEEITALNQLLDKIRS